MDEIRNKIFIKHCKRCNSEVETFIAYNFDILCDNCWEIEHRIDKYLESQNGKIYIKKLLQQLECEHKFDVRPDGISEAWDLFHGMAEFSCEKCGFIKRERFDG